MLDVRLRDAKENRPKPVFLAFMFWYKVICCNVILFPLALLARIVVLASHIIISSAIVFEPAAHVTAFAEARSRPQSEWVFVVADLDGDARPEKVGFHASPGLTVNANAYTSRVNVRLKVTVKKDEAVIFSQVLVGPIRYIRICMGEARVEGSGAGDLAGGVGFWPEEIKPLLDGNQKEVFKCEMVGGPTRYYALFFKDGNCQIRELVSLRGKKSIRLANGERL